MRCRSEAALPSQGKLAGICGGAGQPAREQRPAAQPHTRPHQRDEGVEQAQAQREEGLAAQAGGHRVAPNGGLLRRGPRGAAVRGGADEEGVVHKQAQGLGRAEVGRWGQWFKRALAASEHAARAACSMRPPQLLPPQPGPCLRHGEEGEQQRSHGGAQLGLGADDGGAACQRVLAAARVRVRWRAWMGGRRARARASVCALSAALAAGCRLHTRASPLWRLPPPVALLRLPAHLHSRTTFILPASSSRLTRVVALRQQQGWCGWVAGSVLAGSSPPGAWLPAIPPSAHPTEAPVARMLAAVMGLLQGARGCGARLKRRLRRASAAAWQCACLSAAVQRPPRTA